MNKFKQYNKQFFLREIQNTRQNEVDAMITALKDNFYLFSSLFVVL